jgi:hypothetical protein
LKEHNLFFIWSFFLSFSPVALGYNTSRGRRKKTHHKKKKKAMPQISGTDESKKKAMPQISGADESGHYTKAVLERFFTTDLLDIFHSLYTEADPQAS